MLNPAGEGAREIAVLWWVMLGLGTAVFVLVTVVLVGTVFRRRAAAAPEGEDVGRSWIALGGIALPLVVLLPLTVFVLVVSDRVARPPADEALRVEIVGHQFWWEIHYPDTGAVTANELHIPTGRDVEIRFTSADVIHSFWIPSLAGKMDLIPGEDTDLVVHAERPGVYEGQCAEFCGIQHAGMRLLTVAQEPAEFEDWLHSVSRPAPEADGDDVERGLDVFLTSGCGACHTIRGTPAEGEVGPDLTHLASRRTIASAVFDNTRGNLGGWILNPRQMKPGTLMPPTPLAPEELHALLAYLESLE